VRFTAGDTVLGEVALSAGGTASFTTTALAVGSHEIVAHFVSSVPEIASSRSAAVKVAVAAPKPAHLASTGVDGGVVGGSAVLAGLLLALGAALVVRRRRAAA
jgi:hypothetical protein